MTFNTTVNNIPSLTWNWLRINNSKIELDVDYKDKSDFSVSKMPKGVHFEKDAEKLIFMRADDTIL